MRERLTWLDIYHRLSRMTLSSSAAFLVILLTFKFFSLFYAYFNKIFQNTYFLHGTLYDNTYIL